MPVSTPSISASAQHVVLDHGAVRVELALRPFAITVHCRGHLLLSDAGVWVADGTIHDHFVQFTEGVWPARSAFPGSVRCGPS